jgi:ATP-dependent RNA helicase DeaD
MDSPNLQVGFDRLGLLSPVLQAVQELGYELPTAIQQECIPHLLAGRDLLGQAQTGTGKTAAFALPLLSRIDLERAEPQILVLTPTRELALQVAEAFQRYAHHLPGFHVLPLYGGQSYSLQIRQLRRGAHVIVGTPGRVMDHLRRTSLTLTGIRTLVLDEADEMLKMGFAEDIEWIFDQAPAERQVALFSATMPAHIRRVAEQHLEDPVEVKIAVTAETVETIEQRHCVVTRHHKLDLLTRILEIEPFDAMLVFVRTKTATVELKEMLVAHGFAAEALNGDMTQQEREATVDRLRSGGLDILVATDVAARGLDVDRITHVVNFDVPTDPSGYVHRIGRTGRAGRSGTAILFVEPRERHLLRSIENNIRQRIPFMEPPSAQEVSESRIGRFVGQVRSTLAEADLDFFYRLVTRVAHEQEIDVMDIAAALTFLSQRERPLEVPELGPGRGRERQGERGADQPARPRRDRREGRPSGWEPTQARRQGPERPFRESRPDRTPPGEGGRPSGRGSAAADAFPQRSRPGRERFGPEARREGDDPSRRDRFRDDRSRAERPPRRERSGEERPPRSEGLPGAGVKMAHYRIEVGRNDGVTPRDIVGAIANEAGLEGRFIGRIDIREDHALLDLPEGMPREIYRHLKKVYLRGKAMRLHLFAEGGRDGKPEWQGGERLTLGSDKSVDDRRARPPRARKPGH